MEKLVSVVVVTYNSSAFVIETLDSIKKQTYPDIELIISDDCSKDNTVELCEKWVQENGARFKGVNILKHPHNTGISANCNRGIKSSTGFWIKIIAGDDILLEDCINDNVSYIIQNPGVRVLQSDTYIIDEKSNIIKKSKPIDPLFKIAPPNIQFEYLSLSYCCNTTTLFLEKSVYQEIGWIDEEIKMMEDTQLFARLTNSGIKLDFFDKVTTGYRRNLSSVSFDGRRDSYYYPSIYNYTVQTYEKHILPYLKGSSFLAQKYRIQLIKFYLRHSCINKKNKFTQIIFYILSSPWIVLNKSSLYLIRKKISKMQ